MLFEDIPELIHNTLPQFIDVNIESNFEHDIELYCDKLTRYYFPYVTKLSLQTLSNDLNKRYNDKKLTLQRLEKDYIRRQRHVNIVHDITINDYEMAIEGNVNLLSNAHIDLMKTIDEKSLIPIICKQFENINKGIESTKNYENIYSLLRKACENKFTQLHFVNNNQAVLSPQLVYIIVQVWQIFDQYFKIFNYLEYLKNYISIKNISDIKFVYSILRILVEIGPQTINCKDNSK